MAAPADIAAVVVTYQSAATIDDCLLRLRAAQGVAEIRVVDNGSSDHTLALIQRHAAADWRVRFIGNPDNPGFSVACNQGAADCDAPWLAFVNPDCLVERDTLARLHAHADTIDGDVLLGVELVDDAGNRDLASRRRDPDFRAMLFSADARQLAVPASDSEVLQPVDAVSGALMLTSRRFFARLSGFDEAYRLHVEDLDLCRRARMAGAMVAVANDVRVVHVRGVSSRSRPIFVAWHKHRGLLRYFNRFEAPQRRWHTRCAVRLSITALFVLSALKASRLTSQRAN